MSPNFVGRKDELQTFDDLWQKKTSSLVILYGRRRVGKTRLLTHWLKKQKGSGLYWVAEPSSQLSQLRSFSQALYNFASPTLTAPSDFTYANWEQAFHQVSLLAQNKRLVLFIDELGYIIDANPDFPGILQNAWDHLLKNANVILALSGSQMSIIQNLFDYSGPLYGRASAIIRLPQLPFSATSIYFKSLSPLERLHIYSVWGGVPAYWELVNESQSLRENIRQSFLRSNMLMQQEPLLLLQDFISDPHNYIGILSALASGSVTRTRIATVTGLPEGHMSKYLRVLRGTGFVDRFAPITEDSARSRRGHYHITDPLMRFYYRFLPRNNARLALGEQEEILDSIAHDFNPFVEENTWYELCREWTLRAGRSGVLPISVNEVGGAWFRRTSIPIVGIDKDKKHIVFGAGVYGDKPATLSVISELFSQSIAIMKTLENIAQWRVFFAGFSVSGWEDGTLANAESLAEGFFSLQPWKTEGVKLISLKELDADLIEWDADLLNV